MNELREVEEGKKISGIGTNPQNGEEARAHRCVQEKHLLNERMNEQRRKVEFCFTYGRDEKGR